MTRPVAPLEYPAGALDGVDAPDVDPRLVRALGAAGVTLDTSAPVRAEHARDWWPLSIADAAVGRVAHWPAVVAFATSIEQVRAVVDVARERGTPLTPQGGRSGVVGGAAAPEGAIALDLTGLDRVLEIDDVSGLVRVEAGVFGPDLEAAVNARGFTVGHFPQSFDLATVGGWLACRGAGQYSNRYGTIADIVRGLTVVLANGEVVTLGGRAPREALGPDLVALFVGSEGALGVIVEATLALHPLPAHEARAAYGFASFAEGLDACRHVLQRGAHPAVLRLYDPVESRRHFERDDCVLVVLDEGDPTLVKATMSVVADACAAATPLEEALVARWLEHRNDVSALAPLWTKGFCVDTIEVAGAWRVLEPMRDAVIKALLDLEGTLLASVHQSHAYVDGACLYFTFAARPDGDPTPYYRGAWDAVTGVVLAHGAAISHHHGVGRNRARFVATTLGSGAGVLGALKDALDPSHVMNPGVLGLGATPW